MAADVNGDRVFRVVLKMPERQQTIECAEDEFVWNAADREGLQLPALCLRGQCLTCAARLIEGNVDQTAAATYFPEDQMSGFVLLCSAQPQSDLVIETHQQWAMRSHRIALGLPAPYG